MFQQQFLDSLADAVAQRVVAQMAATSGTKRRLMTVAEAAEYIGRSKQAVYHLIHAGTIPTKRQGARVFIDRVELDRWIDDLAE
ncbi:MAG TPA: helix-turn-helix domain-containing protein [Bryobacteraceae bacterium]|nr:helix-turn-helix domain-containing protein [Bryobacteraceae bacterium]